VLIAKANVKNITIIIMEHVTTFGLFIIVTAINLIRTTAKIT
jgi:hypothetical protein